MSLFENLNKQTMVLQVFNDIQARYGTAYSISSASRGETACRKIGGLSSSIPLPRHHVLYGPNKSSPSCLPLFDHCWYPFESLFNPVLRLGYVALRRHILLWFLGDEWYVDGCVLYLISRVF